MDEFNNIHFVLCLDYRSIILRLQNAKSKLSNQQRPDVRCWTQFSQFFIRLSHEGQSVNEATFMRSGVAVMGSMGYIKPINFEETILKFTYSWKIFIFQLFYLPRSRRSISKWDNLLTALDIRLRMVTR